MEIIAAIGNWSIVNTFFFNTVGYCKLRVDPPENESTLLDDTGNIIIIIIRYGGRLRDV